LENDEEAKVESKKSKKDSNFLRELVLAVIEKAEHLISRPD